MNSTVEWDMKTIGRLIKKKEKKILGRKIAKEEKKKKERLVQVKVSL